MWYPISLRFGKVFTALQGDAKTLVEGMDDCMSLASQITSTLVQYVQTVAPTLTLFEDQITGSLRAFSNHLSVIELPVGELLRVQCLTFNLSVSSSVKIYYLGLYFKLLLPPVILTVGAVLLRSYNRRIRSLAKRVGKARRGLHQARVQKDNLETLCIFLLQFLYPSVTMACCELFLCDEVLSSENLGESQSWLRQDRTIQCYAGSWWIAMGLCLVTAGYYVFGMPIGLFLMLRHLHRHKLYEVIEDGELVGESSADMLMCLKTSMAAVANDDETCAPCGNSGGGEYAGVMEGRPETSVAAVANGDETCAPCGNSSGGECAVCPVTIIIRQDDSSTILYHKCMLDRHNPFERLYKPFERKYYFWSCVILLRMFTFTGFMVIIQAIPSTAEYAIFYALAIATMFWGLHLSYNPFLLPLADRIEYISLTSFLVTVFLLATNEAYGVSTHVCNVLMVCQIVVGAYMLTQVAMLFKLKVHARQKEINTAIAHVLPRAILGAAFTEKYRKGEEEEEEKPDDGEIDDGGDVAFDD
eukprot:gene12878-15218_t